MTGPARTFYHNPEAVRARAASNFKRSPVLNKAFGFIEIYHLTHNRIPTAKELQEFMAFEHDSSAYDCLKRLAIAGKLRRTRAAMPSACEWVYSMP